MCFFCVSVEAGQDHFLQSIKSDVRRDSSWKAAPRPSSSRLSYIGDVIAEIVLVAWLCRDSTFIWQLRAILFVNVKQYI